MVMTPSNTDALIDSFANKVNAANREPLPSNEVPEIVRDGNPNQHDLVSWKIKPIQSAPWVAVIMKKVPKRLPHSYSSLITRYVFPAFQVGPVFIFANTGQDSFWEMSARIFMDGFLSGHLMRNGYIQIGHPLSYNYDPVCFDTKQASKHGCECPLVQISHEEILCNSKLKVVREIAPSFLELVGVFGCDESSKPESKVNRTVNTRRR